MLAAVQVTKPIPAGDAGIFTTIGQMVAAVRQEAAAPTVRETALIITSGAQPRDYQHQYELIKGWMLGHFMFQRDPSTTEYVMTPTLLIAKVAEDGAVRGDCDDAAVLSAALAAAAGFHVRFVVLGFGPGRPYLHIFTQAQTPAGWQSLDTTRGIGQGLQPGQMARVKLVPIS